MFTWGELMRICRKQAKLTQAELAEMAYCSQAQIVAYESGKVVPRVDVLADILSICGYELGVRSKADTNKIDVMSAIMLKMREDD